MKQGPRFISQNGHRHKCSFESWCPRITVLFVPDCSAAAAILRSHTHNVHFLGGYQQRCFLWMCRCNGEEAADSGSITQNATASPPYNTKHQHSCSLISSLISMPLPFYLSLFHRRAEYSKLRKKASPHPPSTPSPSLLHPYSSHRRRKKSHREGAHLKHVLTFPGWIRNSLFNWYILHSTYSRNLVCLQAFHSLVRPVPDPKTSLPLVGSLPASLPAYCSLASDVIKPWQSYWLRGFMLIKAAAGREGEGSSQTDWICCFTDWWMQGRLFIWSSFNKKQVQTLKQLLSEVPLTIFYNF